MAECLRHPAILNMRHPAILSIKACKCLRPLFYLYSGSIGMLKTIKQVVEVMTPWPYEIYGGWILVQYPTHEKFPLPFGLLVQTNSPALFFDG